MKPFSRNLCILAIIPGRHIFRSGVLGSREYAFFFPQVPCLFLLINISYCSVTSIQESAEIIILQLAELSQSEHICITHPGQESEYYQKLEATSILFQLLFQSLTAFRFLRLQISFASFWTLYKQNSTTCILVSGFFFVHVFKIFDRPL